MPTNIDSNNLKTLFITLLSAGAKTKTRAAEKCLKFLLKVYPFFSIAPIPMLFGLRPYAATAGNKHHWAGGPG